MINMYEKAEVIGLEHEDKAWLLISEVWRPNPYYDGEPVAHPQCPNVYHPPRIIR